MKIEQVEIKGSMCMVLKEAYNGLVLETEEGNRIAVSMRDDTFEIAVLDSNDERINTIQRVDMKTGIIHPLPYPIRCNFDPNGMRTNDNGKWLRIKEPDCQHNNTAFVGDAHVYECSCGQRITQGFTPKGEGPRKL